MKKQWFVPAYDSEPFVKSKSQKYSQKLRQRLFKECGGICYLCGVKMSENDFNIDHVIPLSKGGKNSKNNKRAVHTKCNSDKADKLLNN